MAGERKEGQSWLAPINLAVTLLWSKINPPMMLAVSYVLSTLWCCKERLLKWWIICCQGKVKGKRNLSISSEVGLLSYSTREWKGETIQAKQMRKAYEALFQRHHVKFILQVRGDNYCAIRAVLYQVFRKGLSFPSWIKEKDLVKWTEIIGAKDREERETMCDILFSDEDKEYKLYEAVKFILLYLVMEAHDNMMNGQTVPTFFSVLFARDSSLDPLSFMINHLNPVGDTGGLEQVEMFLLGYALEVKIRVFRLYKIDKVDFLTYYPEEHPREWHQVSLVTEDDRHYNIPMFHDK
ncbi:inactive ubiquitin thioesterase OTULINL isoform X2 [Pleurodeles waltl]|uniref:inactive ubiquitin thioesterase OTULINL isoform X2 n=1 Tax=Pleurodeles waltl TaxID=8319 RepID=UPI0037097E28